MKIKKGKKSFCGWFGPTKRHGISLFWQRGMNSAEAEYESKRWEIWFSVCAKAIVKPRWANDALQESARWTHIHTLISIQHHSQDFHTISLNFLSMPILLWVSKYDMFYHQEFLTKLVFVLSSILTVWMKSPLQQWAIFHPDTGLIISQKD